MDHMKVKRIKDSRVVAYDGFVRTTISYPKFILECKYKRLLRHNEDAHHIDNDYKNNILSNLRIINSYKRHKKEQMLNIKMKKIENVLNVV